MASLGRAHGPRGAAIALGAAGVAGAVHGTIAAVSQQLAVDLMMLVASAVLLALAGVTAARRRRAAAVALAIAMMAVFLTGRWTVWSVLSFDAVPVLGALIETVLLSAVATFACLIGREESG